MQQYLIQIFIRDIGRLKAEIKSYENETDLWKLQGDVKNSPGNLTLHLIGNLNHFIGAKLGGTGYVRQRELEFSDKDVPREVMLQKIDEVSQIVQDTLNSLPNEKLDEPYTIENYNETPPTALWLMHLIGHLNYHLGQINYHRRMLT